MKGQKEVSSPFVKIHYKDSADLCLRGFGSVLTHINLSHSEQNV